MNFKTHMFGAAVIWVVGLAFLYLAYLTIFLTPIPGIGFRAIAAICSCIWWVFVLLAYIKES